MRVRMKRPGERERERDGVCGGGGSCSSKI